MTIVNNVTRMLDSNKIAYTAHSLPEEKLGAVEAAAFLGVAPELVYKSIVAVRVTAGKPLLGVVPGNRELDLKMLARAAGEKKVRLATQQQAEELTKLQAGGISPLALINKGFQIFVNETAKPLPAIFVSGGQRGLNVELSPKDLVRLTNARFASLT